MPLKPLPGLCWILLVHHAGELEDWHWPAGDPTSLTEIDAVRWHLFAQNPMANPPRPQLEDERCLVLVCGGCGQLLGDGDHFAAAEYAWEAAEEDGWQGDRCPSCQRAPVG
ncbi:hypothetical protein ACVCAH_11550 [Micromonospora sp. LZ34]